MDIVMYAGRRREGAASHVHALSMSSVMGGSAAQLRLLVRNAHE